MAIKALVFTTAALTIAVAIAAQPAATAPADLGNLPANRWVKLPADSSEGPGYSWSGMAYDPVRSQILHWGGVADPGQRPFAGRNDVLAFDAVAGKWVSDYPSTDKTYSHTGGGGGGQAPSYTGDALMRPDGTPRPDLHVFGVCYDSKRKQLVYTMPGLMAAYDPATRKWADLKAKTILYGKELPGSPPVYGVGTCYDPVDDEIVLFPHFNAKNTDLRDATGQITGHYGTFRYTFSDNTWRRVSEGHAGPNFGSAEITEAREKTISLIAELRWAIDRFPLLYVMGDGSPLENEVQTKLLKAGKQAEEFKGPSAAKQVYAEVAKLLAPDIVHGIKILPDLDLVAGNSREAMRKLTNLLAGSLAVEPSARCAAPMIYDPKSKCIVMFGGHSGIVRTDLGDPKARDKFSLGLDDTWVYDCATRQWRELPCKNRPPQTRLPMMVYDPASELIVLVTLAGDRWDAKVPRRATLWTLDVAKGEWSKRGSPLPNPPPAGEGVDWPGPCFGQQHTGGWTPDQMMALDVKAGLLVIVQPEGKNREQATYVMKLDLSKLPAEPAPAAEPAPPIKPHEAAPDDPAWIEKLKTLPANTWVAAKPAVETPRRDWGSISVDPVRGWVVYFGGGHATYQVSDVGIYNVGANRWTHGVGTHNDFIPIVSWEGSTRGFNGAPPARHMRNQYQTFEGRMYRQIGNVSSWANEFFEPGYTLFYDIDRGGVWREMRIAMVDKQPTSIPDDFDGVHMVDPAGRILSMQLVAVQRYDVRTAKCVFRCYDIKANKLTVRQIDRPFPNGSGGECRPFCYLPDRDGVFWCEFNFNEKTNPNGAKRTWVFDVKANTWTDLNPKHPLPGLPVAVEYVQPAKCVLGIFNVGGKDEQWVYSFDKNAWSPLELKAEGGKLSFQHPYGQMVWVNKFGVLVNCAGGTWVMRPQLD